MKMESKVLFGKPVAEEIENRVKEKVTKFVETYGEVPVLATILVGDDEGSAMYIRMKSKACERVGLRYHNITLGNDCTTEELISVINELNADRTVTGILLQHPILPHMDERQCFDAIDIHKDVDGVTSHSFGKVAMGSEGFHAATALAIYKILKYYEIPIGGKEVVIIGRSAILGKPLSMLMLNENATITMCHSKTIDLSKHLKNADIVLSCVGKKGLVEEHLLKEGAIVIDAGYDQNCGDYLHENLGITGAYTPVPKGVGPVTISCLMEQTIDAAFRLKLNK